jgi:hypothetical protein
LLPLFATGVVDATGFIETRGKFAIGVVDAGGAP